MKKKSITALAAAAAITVGLGAGSYAWFTSTATSTGNVFKTGILNIAQTVTGWSNIGDADVDVTNMQPGDQKVLPFSVNNGTSTLDLKYKIQLTAGTPASGTPNLLDVAKFELTLNGASVASNKSFNEMNDYLATDGIKTLTPGLKTDSYQLIITIPEGTINDYQGAEGSFTITTRATQTDAAADFNFQ
jgi:predicted ribosomally synthesized peptide with SipW-like signal peptide